MTARCTLAAISLAILSSQASFAQDTGSVPALRELMTPEQYRAAGLDKLTEQERQALGNWLRDYTTAPAGQPPVIPPGSNKVAGEAAASNPVASGAVEATAIEQTAAASSPAELDKNWGFSNPPEEEVEEQQQMHATIKGDFKGWSGKNLFYLDNGQVWRQRSSGRFYYTGDDKRVVIGKNSWGFFEMRLIEADRSIGVSRVK